MSTLACQAVVLYKRHIPYHETVTPCQYMVLGHFDGMDCLPEQAGFSSMFSAYLDQTRDRARQHPGCCTSQPVFLIRDRDWPWGDSEEAIARAGNDHPFLFVALLNRTDPGSAVMNAGHMDAMTDGALDPGADGAGPWRQWMDRVDTILRNRAGGRFLYRLFYPLGISQGAVFFYSRDYSLVMNALADLQRDPAGGRPPVQYSYTLPGIRSHYLGDPSAAAWEEPGGPLTVTLNLIVRDYPCCESFIRALNNLFGAAGEPGLLAAAHEMAGNTDIQLRYPGVSPGSIKQAYAALLTPRAACFAHGVSSLESFWSCPVRERTGVHPCESAGYGDEGGRAPIRRDIARLRELFRDLGGEYPMNALRLDDLTRMISAEESPYIHYLQAITGPAVHMLDQILSERQSRQPGGAGEYIRDVHVFMKSLYELYTITLRSDKQFFEAPGFNDVLMEVPIKLLTLYTACLYELQSALQEPGDSRSRQALLVTPGGPSDIMNSKTLFEGLCGGRRIFHVVIPFPYMYDMRLLLPQLTHEIGHSTPQMARNRRLRSRCITDLIARLIVRRIYEGFFEEEAVPAAVSQLRDDLDKSVDRMEDTEGDAILYMANLKKLLAEDLEKLLIRRDIQDALFDHLYGGMFKTYNPRNGSFLTSRSIMETTKSRMTIEGNIATLLSRHGKADDPDFMGIIDFVFYLFSECCADIIMIFLLDMDAGGYLLSFRDEGKTVADFNNRQFSERVAAVVRAMGWTGRIHTGPNLGGDEGSYIAQVRLWLEKNQTIYLDESMQQSLDEYFCRCIEDLRTTTRLGKSRNSGTEMNLITRRLYHAAMDGGEADILSMIQNLIALVNLNA